MGPLCYIDADVEQFEEADCVVAGYYEVILESAGYYDQIAIGLTSDVDSYPLTEFVGYHEKSIAFHCDSGFYFQEGSSYPYSKCCGSGETIGCGITNNGNVFFTVNGILMPTIMCGIDSNISSYNN
jgi:hypothetical protein